MSEPKPKSAGLKAIEYAETQLGVHEVFQKALAIRDDLDTTLTNLSAARDQKRDLEEAITVAELDVMAEERAKHPDMSQAQMDKHVKIAFASNAELTKLHADLRKAVGDLDGCELDKQMQEVDIKILTSRMTELGGYFQYLAVVKLATMRGGSNAPTVNSIPGW